MKQSPNQKLTVEPRTELTGLKYGIQFHKKKVIYVSPAIYSLIKTDFDAVLKTLRVKEMHESDPENPLKKNSHAKKFRSFTKTTFQTRGGTQDGRGLLSEMWNDVDQGGKVRRM